MFGLRYDPLRFKTIAPIPKVVSQSTHIGEDLLAKRLMQPVVDAHKLKTGQADLAKINGKWVVA